MNVLFPFSEFKLKTNLKMAIERMKIVNNKKAISVQHQKREISYLLKENKYEKAAIKVEHIIKDDYLIECYEILQLLCDLLCERLNEIKSNKDIPKDIEEAVYSIIWASNKININELNEVTNQLVKKYGTDVQKRAVSNQKNIVNLRLFNKLCYKTNKKLTRAYLEEIAQYFEVPFNPDVLDLPTGSSVPMAPGSGLASVYRDSNISQDLPEAPSHNHNNDSDSGGLSEAEREEQRQFLLQQKNEPSTRFPGEQGDNYSAPPEPVETIPGTNIPVYAAVPMKPKSNIDKSASRVDDDYAEPIVTATAINDNYQQPYSAPPAYTPPPIPSISPPTAAIVNNDANSDTSNITSNGGSEVSPPAPPSDAFAQLQARMQALKAQK